MTDMDENAPAGDGIDEEVGNAPIGTTARESENWVLCVTFSIKPEHEVEFRRIVSAVIDQMRNEATFVSSSLCHDPNTPGRFFVFEVWRDRDEFFAVQVNRHYRQGYSDRMLEIQAVERTYAEFYEIRSDRQAAV